LLNFDLSQNFFFQAEDGIRDGHVTGVQTCALPISSTGNYCRGGIAISRILDCRATAVLPQGMSEERFEWLRARVSRPEDIIRTRSEERRVGKECRSRGAGSG